MVQKKSAGKPRRAASARSAKKGGAPKRPSQKRAGQARSRGTASGKTGGDLLQRLFVGGMRLAMVCVGIFGVGLILGLYFSQTPPVASLALEEGPAATPGNEPPYRLVSPPSSTPALKPLPAPPVPQVAEVKPEVSTPLVPAIEPTPDRQIAARPDAEPKTPAVVSTEPPSVKTAGKPDLVPEPMLGWQEYAVAVNASPEKPWIAIVLDDVGVHRSNAWRAIELPAPLTLAFMTYAGDLPKMTAQARRQGHELMVHFPMEPQNVEKNDPGENALLLDLPRPEIERRLDWGLSRFDGFVGLNNHMGSRYTEDAEALRPVMTALKERGLLFLDSRTSAQSVAGRVARQEGLPVLVRDVFLDHEPTAEFVTQQLAELEAVALRKGYAIGIGHPQPYTMEVLERWLASARSRGFEIVPLTAILKRRGELG